MTARLQRGGDLEQERFRAVVSRRSTGRTQDIDRHVGGRVRERRIMLGLTQQQLADLIGVTYQQAHKYERGINRISAGRLYEIAQVLSVPIGYFFDGLEDRIRAPSARASACASNWRATSPRSRTSVTRKR